MSNQLSQLKNYWKAVMTSFSIKHHTVTIAFITSCLLPSHLLTYLLTYLLILIMLHLICINGMLFMNCY